MDIAETTALADREIIATRLLDAPRELVFAAWTDVGHLEQWWGPTGFTTTTRRMEIEPGGQWRFVMHGPDGTDYENIITFLEVVAPSRLVYKHGGDKETGAVQFDVVVTFEDEGGKTRLSMRMRFPSNDARDFVIDKYGAFEGLKETMGRLRDHVALQDAFVITRTFDAPLDLVWKAHTEVGHLEKWWGPKSLAMAKATLDLRAGGTFHYRMRAPGGEEMWGRFVYREILPRRRIVWVNSFSDPQGGLARHPASLDWPLEMLIMVTFAETAGRTTLTIRSAPINASEAERRVFKDGYKSMEGGFGGTLDKLDLHLGSAR
jgi:uncharacterized protein YndB with AHSA1/START domain